jgi:hypothetical protein
MARRTHGMAGVEIPTARMQTFLLLRLLPGHHRYPTLSAYLLYLGSLGGCIDIPWPFLYALTRLLLLALAHATISSWAFVDISRFESAGCYE